MGERSPLPKNPLFSGKPPSGLYITWDTSDSCNVSHTLRIRLYVLRKGLSLHSYSFRMGLEPSNSREGPGFLGIYKALFLWGPDMEVEPGNSYIPINVRKTTPRGMQKNNLRRGTFVVAPQSASSFLVFSSCQLRWAEISMEFPGSLNRW